MKQESFSKYNHDDDKNMRKISDNQSESKYSGGEHDAESVLKSIAHMSISMGLSDVNSQIGESMKGKKSS